MNAVYGSGYGDIIPFELWWDRLITDDEYDPGLIVVATAGETPVGFCHGWSEPFVKDIVVAPECRRRGLGRAMLAMLLQDYRDRGAPHADLKVDMKNLAAQALYRNLGFEIIEQVG
ncbi:MAG TPA: GNAT family N-acetyltransferase [Devosia sp.]|nr:GNAT family N-acetyltransferase [Devosia sp.]